MSWILASAYPSDEISAGKVAALVLAVFVGLGVWLAAVYLAERPARQRPPASTAGSLPELAGSVPVPDQSLPVPEESLPAVTAAGHERVKQPSLCG
jgi:hypothetical protein